MAEIGKNGNIDQLLSQKILEGRQINIKSFINWCELEYKGIIQTRYINSGFPKILIKKQIDKNKRTGFTNKELQQLFANQKQYCSACEGIVSRF